MVDDYLKFWGLAQPIFHRPLPYGKIYLSSKRQSQWSRLLLLSQQAKTLQVVSSFAGNGKTALANWLYGSLDPQSHEGFLTLMLREEQKGRGWLLLPLNEFLIGKTEFAGSPWRALAKGLDQLAEEKRQLVLLIDGGHAHENGQGFNELISLLDLCALGKSYVSCVLIGDHSMLDTIEQIPAFTQRLSFYWDMPPLDREETFQYLVWYLKEATLQSCPFNDRAVHALYQWSQGYPARINNLAENCFIEAAQRRQQIIDAAIVEKMAQLCEIVSQQSAYSGGNFGQGGKSSPPGVPPNFESGGGGSAPSFVSPMREVNGETLSQQHEEERKLRPSLFTE